MKNNHSYNNIESFYSEEDIKIRNFSKEELLKSLYKMLLIRTAEYKIAKGREEGIIGGPVHLGVGQEAIAVGVSNYLNSNDKVFGAHRSHSHILSLGVTLKDFFAEILARSSGVSKGMGGSMHLINESIGFYGSVPIVAGTVPIAVGSSLGTKLKKENFVSIAYLGDGAVEEGVVHESLNFARINKCPVIFVVENNQFSSHLNIKLRQPKKLTSRFAEANDIEATILDGNNIITVSEIASEYIHRCRNGEGPFFIEAITYRWFGHVDWRQDIDVGIDRSKKDLLVWKRRDPIKRLYDALKKEFNYTNHDYCEVENSIKVKINSAWAEALKDPSPNWEESKEYVYKI